MDIHNTLKPWKICCISALFFLYVFMELNLFNPISIELRAYYHLEPSEFGHFSALYLYAVALCFFPAGLLLDRYSTRFLMLISLSIAIIATLLFALAPNLFVAKVARILTGMVHGIAFLSAFRMAGFWLPQQRALAMAVVSTIGMLGGVLVQIPLTWLSQTYSWQTAVLALVVLGVVIYVLIFIAVENHPNDQSTKATLSLSRLLSQFREVMLVPQNWIASAYTALMSLPFVLLGALWGEVFLTNTTSISRMEAAQVISMLFIGKIIAGSLVGWYSDKLGLRKPLMIIGAVLTLLTACLIFIGELSYLSLLLLFFCLGFVSSTQSLTYPLIAESNSTSLYSAAMGFACVIIMGGAALFQLVFGFLLEQDWIGNFSSWPLDRYESAYLILPIAFIIAVLLSCFITETRARLKE